MLIIHKSQGGFFTVRKFYPVLIALVIAMSLVSAAFAKDTLVVADQYDATTLDPIGHNDYPTSRACSHIYDTLVFLNPDGTLRPGLPIRCTSAKA